jgi:hypothetical protein
VVPLDPPKLASPP